MSDPLDNPLPCRDGIRQYMEQKNLYRGLNIAPLPCAT
jgi:hypothetical protein